MSFSPQSTAIEGAGKGGMIPPVNRRFGQPEGNPGNPGGVAAAGALGGMSPSKWYAALVDLCEGDLREIVASKTASASKRMAAKIILDGLAIDDDRTADTRRKAVAEISDRLDGKAKSAVDITSGGQPLTKQYENVDTEKV